MELHERVKHLRTEILNNMTQKDFADILGVSRDEINNIEGNRLKKPESKRPLLLLMCAKFGVSEKWLLEGSGDPESTVLDADAALVSSLLDEDNPFAEMIKLIMRAYSIASEKDKEAIRRFAQNLIDPQKENRD